MLHPDDCAEIMRQLVGALTSRLSLSIKCRFRNAKGSYRTVQTNAQPRCSAAGEFLGMIGINVDITKQEASEQALRESEQRFRLAVEAAPSGMVMTDAEGRVVLINAQAERLFGYPREEIVGRKIEQLVPDRFVANHPTFREAYSADATARPMGQGRDLFARRKDGSEVPVEIGLSPIQTADGMMAMAAIVDISARKRAESHRELLVAELNHRVKNTLSIVQAIAYQTFRSESDPAHLSKAFEGRLVALANAHNLLTESSWENASIHELAALTLETRGANSDRVAISGPPIQLPPRHALSLSMALHELATNAKKYGALSNESGQVSLQWAFDPASRSLKLLWRESGGPPVSPRPRRGFGTMLLERTLAQDIEGQVSTRFDPGGVACEIVATLPEVPHPNASS